MREFLAQLCEPVADRRPLRLRARVRQALPGADDRDRRGRAARGCAASCTGSRTCSRASSTRSRVMTRREELEQAAARVRRVRARAGRGARAEPGRRSRLDADRGRAGGRPPVRRGVRALVLDVLNGGVDTTQSQLAHGVRLFADHPDQWELLARRPVARAAGRRGDPALRAGRAVHRAACCSRTSSSATSTFPAGTVVFASAWNANREAEGDERPEQLRHHRRRAAPRSRSRSAPGRTSAWARTSPAPSCRRASPSSRRGMPGLDARRRAGLRHDHRPLRHAVAAGPLGQPDGLRVNSGLRIAALE